MADVEKGAVYQSAADCPLGDMHGSATTHSQSDGTRICDWCGFPVSPTPTATHDVLIEEAASNVLQLLATTTGFGTHQGDGVVAAYYGGHWITLDTNAIARAALSPVLTLLAENEREIARRDPEAALSRIFDALWPLLGGNHTDADTWEEIGTAIRAALTGEKPCASS